MKRFAILLLGAGLPGSATAMSPSFQVDLGFHVQWDLRDGARFSGIGVDLDGRVIVVREPWDLGPSPAGGVFARAGWGRGAFQGVTVGPRAGVAWIACCGLWSHAVGLGTMLEAGARLGGHGSPWHLAGVVEAGFPLGLIGAELRASLDRKLELEVSHPVLPVSVSGRAFRVQGRPESAPVAVVGPEAPSEQAIAEVRQEWTSVFTFLRLARELRALGAPAALVAAAGQAARDEVVHTALCLAMSGGAVVLGALPTAPRRFMDREAALRTLAAEGVLDGCVNEGEQAKIAQEAGERAVDPWVSHARLRIAREERSHAALGRRVAGWCVGAAAGA